MSWKSFSFTSTDSWMLPLALETLKKEYKLSTHYVYIVTSSIPTGLDIFVVEIFPTSMSIVPFTQYFESQSQCRLARP